VAIWRVVAIWYASVVGVAAVLERCTERPLMKSSMRSPEVLRLGSHFWSVRSTSNAHDREWHSPVLDRNDGTTTGREIVRAMPGGGIDMDPTREEVAKIVSSQAAAGLGILLHRVELKTDDVRQTH